MLRFFQTDVIVDMWLHTPTATSGQRWLHTPTATSGQRCEGIGGKKLDLEYKRNTKRS
jgi:hypothetical protein